MTRRIAPKAAPPPPPPRRAVRLRTPGDVRRCLAAVANDMMRGTMDPTTGGKVGYVLSILLKTFEVESTTRQEAEPSAEDLAVRINEVTRLMHATVPPPTGTPGEGNG